MYLKIISFAVTFCLSSNLFFIKQNYIQQQEFRVSYIYLNGKEMSLSNINNLREKIIEAYKSGTSFSELAKNYSMDGNSENGGDLGWFPEGRMLPEFEEAVRDHKKGDIFTIDIPSRHWYYVVLKTHEDRNSE